jgi:hypothetical protein
MQGCYPAFQGAGWMPSSLMRASVQYLSGIIANDPAEAVYFNIGLDGIGVSSTAASATPHVSRYNFVP